MRRLSTKQNVNHPDSDFIYGRIRNNPGNGTGTPFNEELYGDIQQFFERMFAISGLTANGLADSSYTGYQLFEALRIAARPYKSYTVRLTQSSTNPPTVDTVYEDQIGITSITYQATGEYLINKVGAFGASNVVVLTSQELGIISGNVASPNAVLLKTFDVASTPANGVLSGTVVEVRVYY